MSTQTTRHVLLAATGAIQIVSKPLGNPPTHFFSQPKNSEAFQVTRVKGQLNITDASPSTHPIQATRANQCKTHNSCDLCNWTFIWCIWFHAPLIKGASDLIPDIFAHNFPLHCTPSIHMLVKSYLISTSIIVSPRNQINEWANSKHMLLNNNLISKSITVSPRN